MSQTAPTDYFLIVDDDPAFARVLQRALIRRQLPADIASSAAEARSALRQRQYTKAVIDLKIAQDSGLALIQELHQAYPALAMVMLTGYASISTAVDAIKLGARHYLCKPASTQAILQAFSDNPDPEPAPLPDTPLPLDRMEWEIIQQTLQANQGNISATARELGMHRRTLQRKLFKRPSNGTADTEF